MSIAIMLDLKTIIRNNYYHQNFQGSTEAILAQRNPLKEVIDTPEAPVEQNIVCTEVGLSESLTKSDKDKLRKEDLQMKLAAPIIKKL